MSLFVAGSVRPNVTATNDFAASRSTLGVHHTHSSTVRASSPLLPVAFHGTAVSYRNAGLGGGGEVGRLQSGHQPTATNKTKAAVAGTAEMRWQQSARSLSLSLCLLPPHFLQRHNDRKESERTNDDDDNDDDDDDSEKSTNERSNERSNDDDNERTNDDDGGGGGGDFFVG